MTENQESLVTRDETGKITSIKYPLGLKAPLGANESVVLIPFVDELRKTIKDFEAATKDYSKNMEKSSKRMERLTIAIAVLTIGVLVETGVLIYLTSLLIT